MVDRNGQMGDNNGQMGKENRGENGQKGKGILGFKLIKIRIIIYHHYYNCPQNSYVFVIGILNVVFFRMLYALSQL